MINNLGFKTCHSSTCCLFSSHILLFKCTTASLSDHTDGPSDISSCTAFCFYLFKEMVAERKKEKKGKEMNVSNLDWL